MPALREFKYKAFISYSHTDEKWGRWLHRSLESYRTPTRLIQASPASNPVPARLAPVFRDREELSSSPDLSERIRDELQNSENLVVICSPNSARSRWVNQEIEIFKKLGRSKHVFCFIVSGDPTAVGTDRDCFAPAIRTLYDDSGVQKPGEAEPVAADARTEGDGRTLARFKLLAGLLNVGLDELRQREAHRHNRRMVAITSSAVLASVITIGLAINATLARNEADQRRTQAEDLLGFMVGELRDGLEPIGRLDLLESVGEQALQYFSTVDVNNLTESELTKQATVFTQIGEIRFEQLQYEQALTAFTESHERINALFEKDRFDEEKLFNLSQAQFWVGFVAFRSGNLANAVNWLTAYRDSTLSLYSLDPSNERWMQEVIFGHHNLAAAEMELGNLDTAFNGFSLEIEMLNELLERNSDSEYLSDRADALSWLGSLAIQNGQLSDAQHYYRRSIIDHKVVLDREPNNSVRLNDISFGLLNLAKAELLTGSLEESFNQTEEARLNFESLVAQDSSNLNWQRGMNTALRVRGLILVSLGNTENAAAELNSAISHLEDIASIGDLDHNMHQGFAEAFQLLAITEKQLGNFNAAIETVSESLEHSRIILETTTLNSERLGTLAFSLALLAELYGLTNEPTLESVIWTELKGLLVEQIGDSQSPYILDPRVRMLFFTGEQEDALELRSSLQAIGYQPPVPWPF